MNKDLYDALMQMANFEFTKFDKRRGYEWKMSLGLWGALLGSVAIIKDLKLPPEAPYIAGLFSLIIGLGYVFVWLIPLTQRSKVNQSASDYFENEAEKLFGPLPEARVEWLSHARALPKFWWGTVTQIGITALLLVGFTLIIAHLSSKPDGNQAPSMSKVVEILLYTLKPGTGRKFHKIMDEVSGPLHKSIDMDVVAYGNSLHDSDAYYLIRAYNSLEHLNLSQEAFYKSEAWRNGPRADIISRIGTSQKSVVRLDRDAVEALRQSGP